MITLVVWDKHGYNVGYYENLSLKEFGEKLCELSKEWILAFDNVHDVYGQTGCTMEITKVAKRDTVPQANEHMDADLERGIEH